MTKERRRGMIPYLIPRSPESQAESPSIDVEHKGIQGRKEVGPSEFPGMKKEQVPTKVLIQEIQPFQTVFLSEFSVSSILIWILL